MRNKIVKGEYYVYVYLDTRKPGKYIYGDYKFLHEPIYVGKGKRKRAYYFEAHNCFLRRKLVKMGKPVVLLIAEHLPEYKAFKLEIKLIAIIGRFNLGKGTLCNLTNGGEGHGGLLRNEETRRKMSEAKKNMSEETKKRMSEARKGVIFTTAHRMNISKAMKGGKGNTSKRSEETKRKISVSNTGRHRIMSEEQKRKISVMMKGPKEYRRSEEQKRHISEKIIAAWKKRREIIAAKASEMVPLLE